MAELRDELQRTLGDGYTVDRELAGGGMSRVFVATEKTLGREIVVKVVPSDTANAVSVERFKREIQVAAKLQHPHIVPVLSAGETNGVPYYTMPFVKGESLRVRLAKGGELSVNDALHILRDVASALAYAHAEGIVHRDIKPENVMMSGGVAVVTDFGVAKAMDAAVSETGTEITGLTSLGVALGTPAYMAPEQATADPHVDHRADIYSFGCVAYEMLAGSSPFAGRPLQQLLSAHVTEKPDSLLRRRPNVPPAFAALVMKCLEKRPGDRPQSADELIAALDAIATPSGGTAPTDVRIPAARRLPATRYAIGVVVVMVAVIAFAVWSNSRKTAPISVGTTTAVAVTPDIEIDPSISPDGKLVAFVGATKDGERVFVRQIDGGRANILTGDVKSAQARPRWAPDGSRISFVADRAIYIVPALGGAPKRTIDAGADPGAAGNVLSHAWSPDGALIVYSTGTGLWVQALTGGAPKQIASGTFLHSPAWSPNGQLIAYAIGRRPSLSNTSTNSVWIVPAGGGTGVRVSDSTHVNASPAWLPDSRSVLFVSNVGGTRDTYQQAVASDGRPRGPRVRITTSLGSYAISLSKDGTRMAYDVVRNYSNVWAVPVTGGVATIAQARQVTRENQHVEAVGLSPDGQWTAYDSDVGGNFDIYKIRLDGGDPVQGTTNPGNDFSPKWSPDGKTLVFHSSRTGTRHPFTISAEGRDERQVTSGPTEDYYADWLGDDRHVVYFSDLSGTRTRVFTASRDAAGSWLPPRAVTPDSIDARAPRGSPKGDQIAFITGAAVGLISPDGSQFRIVATRTQLHAGPGYLAWSKDGAGLYVIAGRSIWWVPLSGAAPHVVFTTDAAHPFGRPEFDTDGRQIVFIVAAYESDVWVMELKRQ